MRIDEDLKKMTPSQLRKEVMRYRKAFNTEANHTGNHRCWITLEEARTGKKIKPIEIPEGKFLENCCAYYRRNSRVKSRLTGADRKIALFRIAIGKFYRSPVGEEILKRTLKQAEELQLAWSIARSIDPRSLDIPVDNPETMRRRMRKN